MDIQRHDNALIALGVIVGIAVMWFCIAPSWWAVLVGAVCGAGAGTVTAIQLRSLNPTETE